MLLGIVLFGCKVQTNDSSVYIGGEIINPHSSFVLIMQNETIVDSIHLNADNTFGKRIHGLSSGLYSFKHGYEFQYIYLDPYDSIKFRLNTWDFDETIVFEGKGAAKNELLINLFLENEKEAKNFYSYFSLEENEFLEKINLAYNRQKEQLNSLLNSESGLSKEFYHIANAAIDYPLYSLKELYPYYHKKSLPNDLFIVSDDFYKYRKKINLNDTLLLDFHPYRSFVTTYLHNLAYHKNEGKINNQEYYQIVLNLISEKIKNESVKNSLLQREIDYIFINKPEFINSKVLNIFYTNNTDSTTVSNFKQTILKKESLVVNSKFPDFEVVSVAGKNRRIQSITKNKNVVLYFWSNNTVSNEYLNKRILYLTKKHPETTFVGINTDIPTSQNNSCLSKLKNQYYLTASSEGNKLISNKYPRAILINSNGNVSNSFTVLTSNCIDEQINEIANK
ncbi:MAG TPA: hypothetical protein EYG92_11160 [Lutibacter sp.]|nr:hypothetical protein [Lutibacter sp.]